MAFHDDLKKLYDLAGVQNQHTVFLFTDTQVNLDMIFVFNQNYNFMILQYEQRRSFVICLWSGRSWWKNFWKTLTTF